ncbi:High-affinity branched-chain amino acid transport ATP-binding protein LivF [subsurface metagenome]
MLKIKNLKSGYNNLPIIFDINISLKESQIIAIVGSNGAGKSTLLKTICGLIHPMEGTMNFLGKRIDHLQTHEIICLGISIVPEGRQLFPNMNVRENLDIGSHAKHVRKFRRQTLEEVYNVFPKLKEREKQLAGTLSGGEQQMLATARALMLKPKLLLMDEPSQGLAPFLVTELFEKIRAIRESGTSILIVEQNVFKALKISDWSYVIEGGRIVLDGKGEDLLESKKLKEAYLGM